MSTTVRLLRYGTAILNVLAKPQFAEPAADKAMTDAEYAIVNFLRASPEAYYARREIARRAVRRSEYEENPHWADAALAGLLLKGIIEENLSGLYRLQKDAELP